MARFGGHSTDVAGLVVTIPEDRDGAGLLDQLKAGVSLIEIHAPWILSHARRARIRISLRKSGSPLLAYGEITVGEDWLAEMPPSYTASSLVHQIVLDRVRRFSTDGNRMRVTRLVFERRVAFCARLPDGASMVQQLSEAWDAGYYNADQVAASQGRRKEEALAELDALGCPSWVLRALRALGKGAT